jgi:hypothetical protein
MRRLIGPRLTVADYRPTTNSGDGTLYENP